MDEPAAAPKNAGREAGALAAVQSHHAGMLRRLVALSSTLTHAVMAGDSVAEHGAHEVLVEWCETDLVPHMLAEEAQLYGGAGNSPAGGLLTEGLLAEHQVIVALIEELRGCRGVEAAVAAGALRHVFALHLDKENRLLMPFIISAPQLSLAQAVEGSEELVGDAHPRINGDGHGDGRGASV
jgi:hypothetical protein